MTDGRMSKMTCRYCGFSTDLPKTFTKHRKRCIVALQLLIASQQRGCDLQALLVADRQVLHPARPVPVNHGSQLGCF